MTVRLLHIAGLRLGRSHPDLGDRAAARQAETDACLERIVDLAMDPAHEIAGLLIAGDLFDTHCPPQPLVERAHAALQRLTDNGRLVLTVPGCCDEYSYPDCIYRRYRDSWPGTLVNGPAPQTVLSIDLRGATFHFYSMAYTLTLSQPPFDGFSRTDPAGYHVGVFHGALDGSGCDPRVSFSRETVARLGLDYLALGQAPREHQERIGSTLVVAPAIPEGCDFTQPGSGQVCVVTFGEGGAELLHVPLAARPIRSVTVDVSNFSGAQALHEAVEPHLADSAIVQVVLVGSAEFAVDVAQLRADWTPRCYHLDLVDAMQLLDTHRMAALAEDRTIRGLFVRQLRSELARTGETLHLERALREGLSAFEEVAS